MKKYYIRKFEKENVIQVIECEDDVNDEWFVEVEKPKENVEQAIKNVDLEHELSAVKLKNGKLVVDNSKSKKIEEFKIAKQELKSENDLDLEDLMLEICKFLKIDTSLVEKLKNKKNKKEKFKNLLNELKGE